MEKVTMPTELTAENGAKALMIGEFFVFSVDRCPECFGELGERDEWECDTCDESGYVTQKIPIPWTTIKEIYKKAVDNLGEK